MSEVINIRDYQNHDKIYVCNGASNHSKTGDRGILDYYATESKATELLLDVESFKNVWECACGEMHISDILEKNGYKVYKTDIIERSRKLDDVIDFLEYNKPWFGDIITNPPYKQARQFIQKALDIVSIGNKVAMFLKLTFLESKERKQFFLENPPKKIYVSSSRLYCAKNGDFSKHFSSAVAYAWFIWKKGYQGETVIKWIN